MKNPNRIRAERALRLITDYAGADCVKDALVDLLTDIRHLTDMEELPLGVIDRLAYSHYVAELGEARGYLPEPAMRTRPHNPLASRGGRHKQKG